jgi:hypothetical protein
MTDELIKITLCEYDEEQSVGAVDNEQVSARPSPSSDVMRDTYILRKLDEDALTTGISRRTHEDRRVSTPPGEHYGGFASLYQVWSYVTYSGPYLAALSVTAGGGAAFIRNTLGAITEWRKLREGRSINIKVGGKDVSIPDGATEGEVLAAIEQTRGQMRQRRRSRR